VADLDLLAPLLVLGLGGLRFLHRLVDVLLLEAELKVMVILFSLPVARSLAATWTMRSRRCRRSPSICGTPRGAGGMRRGGNGRASCCRAPSGARPGAPCTSTLVCPSADRAEHASDFSWSGWLVLRWISCVAPPARAQRLDGERQRVTCEEQDVLHLAGEDARPGRPRRSPHLVGVDRSGWAPWRRSP